MKLIFHELSATDMGSVHDREDEREIKIDR
jgi:hypothetical protein